MRGKLRYNLAKVIQIRITPADAGKTSAVAVSFLHREDHPRGCGENFLAFPIPNIPPGSPPRMRGKLSSGKPVLSATGITPADAGKTFKCGKK